MAATSLKSDPTPGTTPTPAVVIRTDQHNLIADLLNGVHASERPNLVQKRTSQTGSYTLDVADFLVECDATGGAFTVTLPSAATSGFKNKVFIVKKTDSGSNAITIDPNSTETIDGASTVTLDRQFQTIMLMSDGTNWKTLATFFAIKNADIYTNAAIAYAKLNLSGSLVNADVAAGAAIALSKLAALTASRLLVSDGSGVITVSSVTATEAGYLSGVTSSIQTQLDAKQAASTAATLTGAQDLTNKGINVSRIMGFTYANVTLASDVLAGTTTAIAVDAEGAGATDTLSSITGFSNGDRVSLVAQASQIITVTHDIGGTDAIHLRHKINILLSETVPLVLERRGGEWYEVSGPEITKIALYVGKPGDALATGDNQATHRCDMAGKIIKVLAANDTASTSGTPTNAIRKNATDVLSTNITIDINEADSSTAATPPVIKSDGSEVVAAGDILRADWDVAGTGTKGVITYIWIENLSGE